MTWIQLTWTHKNHDQNVKKNIHTTFQQVSRSNEKKALATINNATDSWCLIPCQHQGSHHAVVSYLLNITSRSTSLPNYATVVNFVWWNSSTFTMFYSSLFMFVCAPMPNHFWIFAACQKWMLNVSEKTLMLIWIQLSINYVSKSQFCLKKYYTDQSDSKWWLAERMPVSIFLVPVRSLICLSAISNSTVH